MKALLSILLCYAPIIGSGDDLTKIQAISEAVIPFKATWVVKSTSNPGTKDEIVTSKTVSAQFINRKLFKVSENVAGRVEYFDWRDSIADVLMQQYVPALSLRTYLTWYDRQVVGVAKDEKRLICQSVSDVRFFGKLRIELERGDPLKVTKVLFFRYDEQGKEIPDKSIEFEYSSEFKDNQFASIYPVYSKVTFHGGSQEVIEEREVWLQIATEIDNKWKPIPEGKFLTGELKAKL